MKTCIVCERSTPDASCVCLELRADEEITFVKAGVKPPASLVYCKPCWSILKDPQAAPQLMRGTAERLMLRFGVAPHRAKRAADKLFTRLIESQRNRLHKTQA
jgi:hypothetical protein